MFHLIVPSVFLTRILVYCIIRIKKHGGAIKMFIFVVSFLVFALFAYFFISRKNFQDQLKPALLKNGFSKSYQLYPLKGSNLWIVKDKSIQKFGVINEKSSKFITDVFTDFELSNCVTSNNLFIGVDNTTRRTCIIRKNSSGMPDIHFFDSKDIISIEVSETTDSETRTITKTNRGSQVLGAAVGGILLGGAGLIVGGVTGSKRSKAKTTTYVNKVELKLMVNDMQNPVNSITLYVGKTEENGLVHQDIMKKADLWNGIFKAIIHSGK